MNTFILHLQDTMKYERIEHVVSFIGEDASGSFGIMAGHERMMASLIFGLASFRVMDQPWQYMAIPGALIYFTNNELVLNTRRFLRGDDYEIMSSTLQKQLLAEEEELQIVKRLWKIGRTKERLL